MGKRSVSVSLTRTVSLQVPCRLWNPSRNLNFLWGLCGIDKHKLRGHRQKCFAKCCQHTFIMIRWTSDNVCLVLNHLMPFHIFIPDWPVSMLPLGHTIRGGSRLNCLIRMNKFPQNISYSCSESSDIGAQNVMNFPFIRFLRSRKWYFWRSMS